MEQLVEELLTLHATSPTFRQMFQSQQTTQLFIDAYKAMVDKLSRVLAASGPSHSNQINDWNIRILEKLTHFGLALALDNAVGGSQKRDVSDIYFSGDGAISPLVQIMNNIQAAEAIIHPDATTTMIDPNLVVDNRSIRQRFASARFSIQVGERTVIKTVGRMAEWRETVKVSERKRLRKMILDL